MLAQLQTAVSLIYPPRCIPCGGLVESDFGLCATCWRDTEFLGESVCDACGIPVPPGGTKEVIHCDSCMQAPPPWQQGRSALMYRDVGRRLVLALKHGDRQEIARPAAAWMSRRFRRLTGTDGLVIPVPLHWSRLLKRRYNQSALLAQSVAQQMQLDCCPDALLRDRRTPSLDGLNRSQRYATLADAIRPHPRRLHLLKGRSVLLIDDVLTTGATLSAATRACLDAGAAEVRVLTLARAPKNT